MDDQQVRSRVALKAILSHKLEWSKSENEIKYATFGGKPYTGWVKYLHSSEEIKGLVQLSNGIAHGFHFYWFENGQKKEESCWVNGKQTGYMLLWYENGNLKIEGNFKDDKLDGLQTDWFLNGHRQAEKFFELGEQSGKCTHWYGDGNKSIVHFFKNGKGRYIQGMARKWSVQK